MHPAYTNQMFDGLIPRGDYCTLTEILWKKYFTAIWTRDLHNHSFLIEICNLLIRHFPDIGSQYHRQDLKAATITHLMITRKITLSLYIQQTRSSTA